MAKKQFKAESKRLLDLMINSIYTHKEIFLRELVSNASDALDKLAYRALTDDKVGVDRSELKITLTPDQIARTLTISDNGIGMTREELESNLGTIARSGSLQFKQDMAAAEGDKPSDVDIIGQFGVGFYSAFMVADRVTVTSRAYGADEAWQWESTGADGYTLTQCGKDTVGTDIVLHIKANTDDDKYDEYLEQYRLAELIKKYSDYVHYPIVMLIQSPARSPARRTPATTTSRSGRTTTSGRPSTPWCPCGSGPRARETAVLPVNMITPFRKAVTAAYTGKSGTIWIL